MICSRPKIGVATAAFSGHDNNIDSQLTAGKANMELARSINMQAKPIWS